VPALTKTYPIHAPPAKVMAVLWDPIRLAGLVRHIQSVEILGETAAPDGGLQRLLQAKVAYRDLVRWTGRLDQSRSADGLQMQLSETSNPFVKGVLTVRVRPEPPGTGTVSPGNTDSTAEVMLDWHTANPLLGFLVQQKLPDLMDTLAGRIAQMAQAASDKATG
jgi:hypothetical protein